MTSRLRVRLAAAIALSGLITLGLLPSSPTGAQPVAPSDIGTTDAQLDEMLAAHQWGSLGAALSRPEPQSLPRVLNWLQKRIDTGGGLLLPIIYARDLWLVGEAVKSTDPEKDVRVTAGLMTLYAFALVDVDGTTCEDRTAPSHRLDQLLQARASTIAFLKTLPLITRMKAVDIAIALERKTAPIRGDDDLVCRDGLAQMKAGIDRGTQTLAPPQPGVVGQRVMVEPPAGWQPVHVPAGVYLPLQDQARKALRAQLLKLVAVDPPPP